jgi:hypothetical protein
LIASMRGGLNWKRKKAEPIGFFWFLCVLPAAFTARLWFPEAQSSTLLDRDHIYSYERMPRTAQQHTMDGADVAVIASPCDRDMSVREHTELLEKRVGVMGPHGQKSELLKLRPYAPCVQILPHEVYLACRIETAEKVSFRVTAFSKSAARKTDVSFDI